jgi:tRNA 5-methylaminomethyl-2-thiouridine biosynthesis bifunctional protein
MSEPLDWSGPAPRSPRFDDIYFSPEDGLAESQAVFLNGCGLPDAWAGRRRFVVGELGFGSGLNILALIDLWRRAPPGPGAVLQVFSIEAFPMSRADAARALGVWPALADIAAPLLASWPEGRRGFHRIEWPDLGVILDLAIMEAQAALTAWSGPADAWFLDGFAPSKNPQMWDEAVFALVAARSAPGARAATFSVAGVVRRGLESAGFALTRAPGFGRKKERLEARLPQETAAASDRHPPRVAIIGAGVAGAALARGFHRLGVVASVFDEAVIGAGASGNPAALVTPRLDAGLGAGALLHAEAFARAVQLYRLETPFAIIGAGALELSTHPRDLESADKPGRFAKIAGWDGFDPGAVAVLDAEAVAAALDEASAPVAVSLRGALVLEPRQVLDAWLPQGAVGARIDRLEPAGGVWRLLDETGALITEADIVCLAGGPAAARLAHLPLRPVRGQVSFTETTPFTGRAASWSGYAIPLRAGTLFGATHARDDWGVDLRPEDDVRNLDGLRAGRPGLAGRVDPNALSSRAALRAMTPDYLPLAGGVSGPAGLFVLSGLGGRGFTLAPLLGEAVAAQALGAPSPLARALSRLVDPRRF